MFPKGNRTQICMQRKRKKSQEATTHHHYLSRKNSFNNTTITTTKAQHLEMFNNAYPPNAYAKRMYIAVKEKLDSI